VCKIVFASTVAVESKLRMGLNEDAPPFEKIERQPADLIETRVPALVIWLCSYKKASGPRVSGFVATRLHGGIKAREIM
jgi:hypothetical protein